MADRKHAPELVFRYLPAIELVVAADSAGPRTVKEAYSEGGVNPVRERLAASISPFDLSDLDFLFAPVSTAIFLFYLIIRDGNHTGEALIRCLDDMQDDEFCRRFKQLLQIDETVDDWVNVDLIEEALDRDRARETVPYREEATQLMRLLSSPGEFRKKLVEVLSWFTTEYFSSQQERLRNEGESWINHNRDAIEAEPRVSLNLLTKESYDAVLAGVNKITLYPISDSANSDICLMVPDDAYFVFSTSYADAKLSGEAGRGPDKFQTDLILEAVGDPKRLAMLRILRTRPHYSRELAEALGIAPSTASYHIEKLISARLVRLQLSEGRRFYYEINQAGFRRLIERIEGEFIEG